MNNEAHHPRGMSRWPAILACACFTSKPSTSSDATFGTEKHAQLADMLNHLKQFNCLPEPLLEGFYDNGVRRAAEFIRDCLIATNVNAADIHVEERVTLEGGIFGTADLWYMTADKIVVWDFKTFHNPGRDYTAQLAGYALAIRQKHSKAPDIFSLRTIYADTSDVNEVTISAGEAFDIYFRTMQAFDATNAQPTQCNWCELCANAASCPAYRAVAEAVTQRPDIASAPARWAELTPANKAQLLVIAEAAAKWSDIVREAAKNDLIAGAHIADQSNGISYKLRHTSGRKTPRKSEACAMLQHEGVSVDDISSKLTLAASAIKDLLKGKGVKGKAAEALLDSVCDFGNGSVQMVRG